MLRNFHGKRCIDMNRLILHGEGLIVLLMSLYLYWYFDFSWLIFIILLFLPDLSMIAYVKNDQIGAIIYNLFHTYILPVLLFIFSHYTNMHTWMMISIIWLAHIGMDRMIGYGLKYPSA